MSRSRRRTKIFGITTKESEKQDKRIANRKFRKRVKDQLNIARQYEDDDSLDSLVLPELLNEVHDEWIMDKDGKKYWGEAEDRDMRK